MKRISDPMDFASGALDLFARKGLDRVTMDEIAAEARVTKGSLYWHFKSKDEVIEAACRHLTSASSCRPAL